MLDCLSEKERLVLSGASVCYKMADVPSTGDAAINLRDDNRRVSRERHKRYSDSPLDSTKICLFQQNTSSINKLYQCLNAIDSVACGIKSCNKSNNQQVIVVVEDPLSLSQSNDNINCQEIKVINVGNCNNCDSQLDNKESDVVSNRDFNVDNNVSSTNVTLLTSWTSMSTINSLVESVDGPLVTLSLVESLQVRSERTKERNIIKSMGKSGCIKHKKKIEKMLSAIVCSESREVGKDKQHGITKEKKGLFQGRVITTRLQDTSFKEQIKSSEDKLIGPCGKKRCADRYDSSESSDR